MGLGVQGPIWGVGGAALFAGLAAWRRRPESRAGRDTAEIVATGAAGALLVLGPLVSVFVYVPTHLRLRATGEEMRDAWFPACFPGDADYDDNKKHREEMDNLLELHEGPVAKLKSPLVILTPLLGTLAATVVGT